ncbi:MAG TPA: hypothetical protein VKR06_40690 [Ktedonosporobacter sp.]|nr:hypothetical protein [Ktedonosporobacter sp.]
MELLTLFQKAYRVRRFIIVQFIALVGWIIVQSSFSLTPAGQSIPFQVMIVSEGIWWIALLAIMLILFTREYNSFAHSALELEDANKQLREATNRLFVQVRDKDDQGSEPIPQPQEEPVAQHEEVSPQHEEEPVAQSEEVAKPQPQEEPEIKHEEEPELKHTELESQPQEEPVTQQKEEPAQKVPEHQTASSTDG